MKKSIIMMCVGGLLALCVPASASESPVVPPIKNEVSWEKPNRPVEKSETVAPKDNQESESRNVSPEPEAQPHSGGVVVISGAALLLIIILLIILL